MLPSDSFMTAFTLPPSCTARLPSSSFTTSPLPQKHDRPAFARPSRVNMLFDSFFKSGPSLDLEVLAQSYPAIRVHNLRKTYKKKMPGAKKKDSKIITAIDGLSFTVPRGKVLGLLGPNSSGKTSTLRCMATLSEPDSGTIEYYGLDAVTDGSTARKMIGFVMQSAGLDKVLTGREHLDLFADLAHVEWSSKKMIIDMLIDLLDLGQFIDRQAGVYSGGVVRRLDMAIALLHQPSILILDEPTVGLDIETRRVIWNVLRIWRERGGTIILTSHYLEEVDVLSDHVGILDKGVLIAYGTPSELKASLGGDRISIRLQEFTGIDQAEVACGMLKKRGLAQEALINRLQNNSIELVVDADNASIGGDIVQALSENGFERLFSFAQSKPSLDDVYLAATGSSIGDADMSAKESRTDKSMRKENMA